jgi:hypothetical protein
VLGATKARRAMAARLSDAVAHVTGAIGATITVTLQEAAGDTKTGAVPFSTYCYLSWGPAFHAQDLDTQEKIAVAHLSESMVALQKQLDAIRAQFAEARKVQDAELAKAAEELDAKLDADIAKIEEES